jgi:hypothetical protein
LLTVILLGNELFQKLEADYRALDAKVEEDLKRRLAELRPCLENFLRID